MAKAFSIASWNVEHFKSQGVDSRVTDVVAFLKQQNPDVFALYEVEGAELFGVLTGQMPNYTFHITEGAQVQEILVGVKQGITAFFTQKTEFRTGVTVLRPGALLTVTVENKNYPLLFLHVKSGVDPRGWGLRDDILKRAVDFRSVLDKAAAGNSPANYIFLGDLNIMGMDYMYLRERDIDPDEELLKLERAATRKQMKILSKDEPATWWGDNRLPPSNLDHVVAAEHLNFKSFQGNEVSVIGWPKRPTVAEKKSWVRRYSDHALLYFEVQKV